MTSEKNKQEDKNKTKNKKEEKINKAMARADQVKGPQPRSGQHYGAQHDIAVQISARAARQLEAHPQPAGEREWRRGHGHCEAEQPDLGGPRLLQAAKTP